MNTHTPVVLTIAGVDPSGGAGIFADFRAIECAGVRALGAVTALTVQTENSFLNYEPTSVEMLVNTVDSMAAAFDIGAIKTGMLPTAAIVNTVAELIRKHRFNNVVIDPVIIASVGARLIDEQAEAAMRDNLAPLATLLTPNMPEAAALTGLEVTDVKQMIKAGEKLVAAGTKAVAVTGGHLQGEAVDLLITRDSTAEFSGPRLPGSVHGTGCSFSASAAAALAQGASLSEAVEAGKAYVRKLFTMQQWRTG